MPVHGRRMRLMLQMLTGESSLSWLLVAVLDDAVFPSGFFWRLFGLLAIPDFPVFNRRRNAFPQDSLHTIVAEFPSCILSNLHDLFDQMSFQKAS
mmetsp:Transcript_5785/g.11469  ORF Transcript_5785/g.11469 Transcript_5785/m.11469 type:complete len:95 (-) Transcript_5785:1794-2078(-)